MIGDGVALLIGVILALIGVVTWRNPIWIQKAGYRWTDFVTGGRLSPGNREDMELLFSDTGEWIARHKGAVRWTRITVALPAVAIGVVMVGLAAISMMDRSGM